MKGSRTLLTLAVTGIVMLALAPAAASSGLTSQEQSLLRAVNGARAAHGAPPVRVDSALQRAARSHSRAMVRTGAFTHGNWYARLRRHGVRGRTFGENIAWGAGGAGSADSIVRMWLASPPHRATLLKRGFRRVGVGVAIGPFGGFGGAHVATADFAGG